MKTQCPTWSAFVSYQWHASHQLRNGCCFEHTWPLLHEPMSRHLSTLSLICKQKLTLHCGGELS